MCQLSQPTILSCISLLYSLSRNCVPAVVVPHADNSRKPCQPDYFPILKTSGFFFFRVILFENLPFRKYRNQSNSCVRPRAVTRCWNSSDSWCYFPCGSLLPLYCQRLPSPKPSGRDTACKCSSVRSLAAYPSICHSSSNRPARLCPELAEHRCSEGKHSTVGPKVTPRDSDAKCSHSLLENLWPHHWEVTTILGTLWLYPPAPSSGEAPSVSFEGSFKEHFASPFAFSLDLAITRISSACLVWPQVMYLPNTCWETARVLSISLLGSNINYLWPNSAYLPNEKQSSAWERDTVCFI